MFCMGFGFLFVVVLVDFELILFMFYWLMVDIVFDSFCYGMEVYVSRKANLFVDLIVLLCIFSIVVNVGIVCVELYNWVVCEVLMLVVI